MIIHRQLYYPAVTQLRHTTSNGVPLSILPSLSLSAEWVYTLAFEHIGHTSININDIFYIPILNELVKHGFHTIQSES